MHDASCGGFQQYVLSVSVSQAYDISYYGHDCQGSGISYSSSVPRKRRIRPV